MDIEEYFKNWEKANNPFYPESMRWDRITIRKMLSNYKILTSKGKHINFETFWGERGEKWNGKLDIKEFAREIYTEVFNKLEQDNKELRGSKQFTIEEIREKFENMQTKKYNLSKKYLIRFSTGNYKDRDIERDWMGFYDCMEVLGLIKE